MLAVSVCEFGPKRVKYLFEKKKIIHILRLNNKCGSLWFSLWLHHHHRIATTTFALLRLLLLLPLTLLLLILVSCRYRTCTSSSHTPPARPLGGIDI